MDDRKPHEVRSKWAHAHHGRRLMRHVATRQVGSDWWTTDCGRQMHDPDVMDGIAWGLGEQDCLRCNFESLQGG